MARYHGRQGRVYISTSAAGMAVNVGALTEWSLDGTQDRVDVTAFADANKQYVLGLRDVSGTISGWWDDTIDTVFDASDSADGCRIYLYPSNDAATKYWYGPAWLDASVTTGVADAVRITANFVARGDWGRR